MPHPTTPTRRAFLRWMAASPALAATPVLALGAATACDRPGPAAAPSAQPRTPRRPSLQDPIPTPADALDVFDLERTAETTVPPAHFGYIQTGVDGESTQHRNRAALEALHIRPRRLVDVSRLDTRVTLFGREWPTPIVIAPCGSQRAFHPDGEIATARAARSRNHLQVLSSVSSTAIEQVAEARAEPVWYQLYPTSNWQVTRAVVDRTRRAECPVIILTVDLPWSSNRLTQQRWARIDDRDCASCHRPAGAAPPVKPMYQGTPFTPADFRAPATTWRIVDRLRGITDQKIVVKGIMTGEDAELALARGVDAIWVSNHGGRAEGSGQATIAALPEIAAAASGRAPIIVDGGFRRGSDIFKGIALGADAVAVGRPYLWGLGAFGQSGVERVLDILRDELGITMRLAGTPSLAGIGAASVGG